ncbi:hypothetical protein [Hymenobacter rubidus]|uniref:hypothetical protein n=1 Tax=Hymenobacter rubidus TaxID=1441626 RepID=UPI00191E6ABB|nr:hypothetical protein [Hymenobacter rubidus]
MKNKKKTKAAKPKNQPTGAGQSLRKAGKRIAKLSTTKKAVGVLALATLGLSYLAKRRKQAHGTTPIPADDQGAE